MIVASIDTHTGNTVLFSVGRNTQRLQFQPGTPLAEAYPGGYATNPGNYTTGNIADNWLDSAYDNIPRDHSGLLGATDNEGADALKLGLGYSLFHDQHAIDYYVLISLQQFQKVINALGGLTVNVNNPVPIGGMVGGPGESDTLPNAWIMTGQDKHLDGHDALWFARGRYGTGDRDRVVRQRCTINALTNQATPARVLQSYTAIADSAADVTQTDIPQRVFPALLELANTIKSAKRSSLSVDENGIPGFDQFTPDWGQVRAVVQTAIDRSNPAPKPTATAAPTTPAPGTIPPATSVPIPTTASSASASGPTIDPDLDSSCAYDPAAAKANLAAWENTWSGRYNSDGTSR